MSFNKVIIVGHLGRDPELRYTPQGVPVCTFSVATTEKQKSGGGGKPGDPSSNEVTTWFRVTLWREKAEVASKYLAKGRLVYIEGRLSVREWQDREGKNQTSLEVTGSDVQFIDNRDRGGAPPSRETGPSRPAAALAADEGAGYGSTADITDDDIPF